MPVQFITCSGFIPVFKSVSFGRREIVLMLPLLPLSPKPAFSIGSGYQPQSLPVMNPLIPLPEDSFGRIGSLDIRPDGELYHSFEANVNAVGQVTQMSLNGPELLGQLQANGNFQLKNGIQGNVFNSPFVRFFPKQPSEGETPFVKQLRATERERAAKGSELVRIRSYLTNQGINGAGIKVGILDGMHDDEGHAATEIGAHSKAVAQTVNDPVWGVAPFAEVEQLGKPVNLNFKIESDTPQALATKLTKDYLSMYTYASNQLQAILAKGDPALRVINITAGLSPMVEYINSAIHVLNERDKNDYPLYPNLTKSILGNVFEGTHEQKLQALINYIDQTLANSPVIKQAYLRYVEMTRQAAAKGIVIVAAAGNENNAFPLKVQSRPGVGIDELAKSPYVIMVAASNTNQTPGVYADDQVTGFSSRGDGYFNPTVAAPGQEIGISYPEGKIGHNLTVGGTSFSTPFTCGVIALMLQRNPFLSFDQVKAKLQNTAVKSPYYGPADYGAGFLNPVAAVLS